MERIAPSATLEAQIADVLSRGIDDNEQLVELGRLGTRLVLQRAVEDEVAAFLGRARYERVPSATGSRNGSRNKPIQTAEGEDHYRHAAGARYGRTLRESSNPGRPPRRPYAATGSAGDRRLRTRSVR